MTDETKLNNVKRHVGLKLPLKIYKELEKIAKEEERSVSSIIRQAVKEFLRRRENAENQI